MTYMTCQVVHGHDDMYTTMGIMPYMFQPVCQAVETARRISVSEEIEEPDFIPDLAHFFGKLIRLYDDSWCQCGICCSQPIMDNCHCCQEVPQLTALQDELEEMGMERLECVTQHPGFRSNCLDIWVLRAHYHHYRSQNKPANVTLNEKYRYTAYRGIVSLAWGWLGEKNRVKLPSCILRVIRETFPGNNFTGHLPPLPFVE